MGKNAIAIITARGGSKRIPRKNIKTFLGYPIIKYSIEAALNANIFEEVMVSTEDDEIASVAKKYGATVPFFRSANAASDFTTTAAVLLEVIEKYQEAKRKFEFVCCVYPTAPFVTGGLLCEGLRLLNASEADSVIPVVRFGYPIQRALKIEKGMLKMVQPENLETRSQDLMPLYHDAGQFYWLRVSSFLEQKKVFANKTFPIEVPELAVQDIDNEDDWIIAEYKYRMINMCRS